jgi:hypothetical protein
MIVLRRVADRVLLGLAMIAAVLVCWAVTNGWPSVWPRPDAAMPLPHLPAELRGPTVEDAIDRLSREAPQWASSPDVVE